MPKDKLLPKITHAILETKTKKIAESTGIHAVLSLCFGPGDLDRITQIHMVSLEDRLSWRPPHVQIEAGEKKKKLPVFTGRLALEIGEWCQTIYDTIKKQCGKIQYGKKYRLDLAGKLTVSEG